jgi:hypothetical protein
MSYAYSLIAVPFLSERLVFASNINSIYETKSLTLRLQQPNEQGYSNMPHIRKIANSSTLDFFTANTSSHVALPFMDGGIAAGFPSPAQDYIDLKTI